MKLLQRGNSKLGQHMRMWNMPAIEELCGRECENCYARREEVRWPSVRKARQLRYEASLQSDFVQRINTELLSMRKKPKYLRIHASSEFYSQEYIQKWCKIIEANPDIVFYAYTKRLADFNFTKLGKLPNMVLIDSLLFGDVNYGKKEDAPKGVFICPAQKGKVTCGLECKWCMTKGKADKYGVFFIKH